MASIGMTVKTAEWKTEKHVPAIDAPETVKVNEAFDVTVQVGKEIAHPHTSVHFIEWISLYLVEEGKPAYALGRFEFSAHGASAEGADKSGAYADPKVTVKIGLAKSATLKAVSYCNIHGLWEGEKAVLVA
jgi:superoxide reductase